MRPEHGQAKCSVRYLGRYRKAVIVCVLIMLTHTDVIKVALWCWGVYLPSPRGDNRFYECMCDSYKTQVSLKCLGDS